MSSLPVLVAIQLLMYGLSWALAALLLPSDRLAMLHWSVYGLLAAASVAIVGWFGLGEITLLVRLGTLMSCVSYIVLVRGVDMFVNGRARDDRIWSSLLVANLLVQGTLWWIEAPAFALFLSLNVGLLALLTAAAWRLGAPVLRGFGWVAGGLALLPLVVLGTGTALRTVYLLSSDPAVVMADILVPMADLKRTVPTIVAAAMFNLAFLALLVQRQMAQLRHTARHDALTGLLNRASLEDTLNREWARRPLRPLSVAFVDIDHFKRINDTAGHAAGDQALVHVARLLRDNARLGDVVARMGGEEFVVLMPGADRAGAVKGVERLQAAFRAQAGTAPGTTLRLSLSIGVASASSADDSPSRLLQRADAAMYRAKQAGRDRIEVDEA